MSFHQQLKSKIAEQNLAAEKINSLKTDGKKIVFTNGCFDIIHPGHVDYLTQARDLGDFLVLGLNTDNSVRVLNKAPNRPINNQHSRAMVLAALACVDCIVLFDEETPYNLINCLQPDILVKGNDYEVSKIVGYDIVTSSGGKVITIPFLEGFSTTSLIKKILA